MLVDDLTSVPTGDRTEQSARVRWSGGDSRPRIVVPTQFVTGSEDGSPFLAATMLLAMRRGDDLEIAAPVSRAFLENCELIQRIYRSWDASLTNRARRAGRAVTGHHPADVPATRGPRRLPRLVSKI
jgi:hypothetical protein